MFVQHRAVQAQTIPVQNLARPRHGAGQRHALIAGHAAQQDGHRQGGHLAFAPTAIDQAAHEGQDLRFAQVLAIALAANDVGSEH